MKNSYDIIRAIAQIPDMTYAERFAGAILALHLDRKHNHIAVKQSQIAQEAGLQVRCVRSAVAKMVKAGLFTRRKTNDRLVLKPVPKALWKESGLYVLMGPAQVCLSDRHSHAAPPSENRLPWDYDTTFSTLAEERFKRLEKAAG